MSNLCLLRAGSSGVGAGSTLLTGPSAYWQLNEASGNALDSSPNALTLTQFNGVGSAAGKLGGARAFTAVNTQYLQGADTPALEADPTNGFTLAAWVWLTSKTGNMDVASKDDGTFAAEYKLHYLQASDRFDFTTFKSPSTQNDIIANTFGSPALSTWLFVVAWYDPADLKIRISVNN